jgi:hypothetical protein
LGGLWQQTSGASPDPDQWVWMVNLGVDDPPSGGSGTFVVLDYYDGHVIQINDWVA